MIYFVSFSSIVYLQCRRAVRETLACLLHLAVQTFLGDLFLPGVLEALQLQVDPPSQEDQLGMLSHTETLEAVHGAKKKKIETA